MTTTYQIIATSCGPDAELMTMSGTGEWHVSPVSPYETSDEAEAREDFGAIDADNLRGAGWRGPVTLYLEAVTATGDDVEMEVIETREIEA